MRQLKLAASSVSRPWVLLVFLGIAMAIAYIDRINLSVVLAFPGFINEFGFTDYERGLVSSAFFWSYTLCMIPAGVVVDRFGTKYSMALAFALWSIASAAMAFATTLEMLFILRFALGVTESVVAPAILRWIRYNIPTRHRTFAIGIYTSSSKIGTIIAVPLVTMLIGFVGWRGMFVCLGLGGLLWLIPWLFLSQNDYKRGKPAEVGSAQVTSKPMSFPDLMRMPALWGLVLGTFCLGYFFQFSFTWMPAYLVEQHGLTKNEMAAFIMFSFSCLAIVSPLGGVVADKIIHAGGNEVTVHRRLTILGMIVSLLMLVVVLTDSLKIALVFLTIALTGLGLTLSSHWALLQALVPASSTGRGVGIQNAAGSFSGVAASILTGGLLQLTGNYDAPIYLILVFLVIGVAAYQVLARERFSIVSQRQESITDNRLSEEQSS